MSFRKTVKRRLKIVNKIIRDFSDKGMRQRAQFTRHHDVSAIRAKAIFYESRDGKSINDSPWAIYKHLRDDPRFADYEHIWSVWGRKRKAELERLYSGQGIRFALKGSAEYRRLVATSKYLINNSTFPVWFQPKDGQVYVNTWHGTPLKHMGFRIKTPYATANVLRNLLHSDFLVTPNAHTSDIFLNDYKLRGIYRGTLLESGAPRMDLTVRGDRRTILERLRSSGVSVEDAEIFVLYAPTWKGGDFTNPRNDVARIVADIATLQSRLGDRMRFAVKLHPFLYERVRGAVELEGLLIPDDIDANELLGATDVLITDYSSIFFDFLITGKPILFYMWDEQDYTAGRGLYIDPSELPGPVSRTVDELADQLGSLDDITPRYRETYETAKARYSAYDDGGATQRVVDAVFFADSSGSVVRDARSDKRKLLIYPGGMMNNGITESILALVKHIDYTRYDVTFLMGVAKSADVLDNVQRIDENVRLLYAPGYANRRLSEIATAQWASRAGVAGWINQMILPTRLYRRQSRRCVAQSVFDTVIDYSGYSFWWAMVLRSIEAKRYIVYMHADLAKDREKRVKGRKVHYHNLKTIATLYEQFDAVVNVSHASGAVNEANFRSSAPDAAFEIVSNPIDHDRIIEGARDRSGLFQKDGEDVIITGVKQGKVEWASLPADDEYSFVNVARLSPEKGQSNLVSAFAQVNAVYPNTSLFIVGDGALRGSLESLALRLGVGDRVHFTGHQRNPFPLVRRATAFVLSSHYEGLGLVLLEAMALGCRVVSTDIPASREVLDEGRLGLLVEDSVEGLRDGMLACIEQPAPAETFDVAAHNAVAVQQFYDVVNR